MDKQIDLISKYLPMAIVGAVGFFLARFVKNKDNDANDIRELREMIFQLSISLNSIEKDVAVLMERSKNKDSDIDKLKNDLNQLGGKLRGLEIRA